MSDEKYLGYLKYSGEMVDSGFFDARKSAQALLGFDEAIRFFVGAQNPDLKNVDFEMPVQVRKGSWEVSIPGSIEQWVLTSVGVMATAYLAMAGKKMAENDFKNIGLRDIFRKSLEGIQWLIRIGKHLGDLKQKKFYKVKFRNDNQEIGLPNASGEILFVPIFFFDLFQSSNPKILSKIAELVENQRLLTIGVFGKDGEPVEEPLSRRFRHVFTQEDTEPEDVLFPELKHGQIVSLEGNVTRGNETSNSLGFRYEGHILFCEPEKGSIKRFKSALFEKARIHGTISRADTFGGYNAKRPKIIFNQIESIEEENNQPSLFKGNK
jgi:hypothetical protein